MTTCVQRHVHAGYAANSSRARRNSNYHPLSSKTSEPRLEVQKVTCKKHVCCLTGIWGKIASLVSNDLWYIFNMVVFVQAFVDIFGEYAGWAHNALFVSELSAQKHLFAEPVQGKADLKSSPGGVRLASKNKESLTASQGSDSTALSETLQLDEQCLLGVGKQAAVGDEYNLYQTADGAENRAHRKRKPTQKAAELAMSRSVPRRARRTAS